jgi:hypothetical protein
MCAEGDEMPESNGRLTDKHQPKVFDKCSTNAEKKNSAVTEDKDKAAEQVKAERTLTAEGDTQPTVSESVTRQKKGPGVKNHSL